MTGARVDVALFYFVCPLVEAGGSGLRAQGWVVDTAGHEGGYTQQGLGCWPTIGLFWAPDLHLQPMLLITPEIFKKRSLPLV